MIDPNISLALKMIKEHPDKYCELYGSLLSTRLEELEKNPERVILRPGIKPLAVHAPQTPPDPSVWIEETQLSPHFGYVSYSVVREYLRLMGHEKLSYEKNNYWKKEGLKKMFDFFCKEAICIEDSNKVNYVIHQPRLGKVPGKTLGERIRRRISLRKNSYTFPPERLPNKGVKTNEQFIQETI